MNEKLEALKANISASLERTRVFYSSHRTLLLSGLTVLSILLIVWARMGFTTQVGRFFAEGDICRDNSDCPAGEVCEFADSNEGRCVAGPVTPTLTSTPAPTSPSCAATRPSIAGAPESICARPAAFDVYYSSSCTNPTRGGLGEYYYISRKTREDGTVFVAQLGCVEHPDNCPEGMAAWSSNYCLPTSDPRVGGGGGTPVPTGGGGLPAPAVLAVTCTATQAILTWNIPAGSVQNVVQKNVNNQGWQTAYADAGRTQTTFTETFVATTVYRHKTDPNVVSNSVQCPSGGVTPTPAPPGTPSVLTGTCSTTQNVLSWTLPAGRDSNSLQRKIGVAGNWVTIGTGFTLNTPTTYPDIDVQAGQTYVYRHKALASTPSNEITCSSSTPTPTPTPVYPPLQCAPINQTVALNQIATVTAVGGSGTYQWELSGSGVQQGGTATSVNVSYSVSGQKIVRVSSAGQIATCVVTVTDATATPTASVTPTPGVSFILAVSGRNATTAGVQSTTVQAQGGQQVEVVARISNAQTTLNNVVVRAPLPNGFAYVAGSTSVGGTPTAVESITSSGLSLGAMGPQQETTIVFRARVVGTSFAVGTTQAEITVSATADGATQQSGALAVVVTTFAAGVPGTVPTGPGDAVLAALLMSAIMTLLYVSYTHTSAYKRKEIETITQERDPMDFRS